MFLTLRMSVVSVLKNKPFGTETCGANSVFVCKPLQWSLNTKLTRRLCSDLRFVTWAMPEVTALLEYVVKLMHRVDAAAAERKRGLYDCAWFMLVGVDEMWFSFIQSYSPTSEARIQFHSTRTQWSFGHSQWCTGNIVQVWDCTKCKILCTIVDRIVCVCFFFLLLLSFFICNLVWSSHCKCL